MSRSDPTTRVAIITFLLLISLNTASVKCSPDTTIEDLECNPVTWATGDPYGLLVQDVFTELVNNGASQPSYAYYVDYEYDYDYERVSIAYGASLCNTLLVPQDCAACLSSARDTLARKCSFAIGGFVKMADCSMRYEKYPFYG